MRTALALAFVLLAMSTPALAQGELDAHRERFRSGLEKYKSGQFADAIVVWEDILKEIGPKTGYRLAFNLGRAYEAFGSASRAAERYDLFLTEVAARRRGGIALEPQVEEQAVEAEARLRQIAPNGVPPRVDPSPPPPSTQPASPEVKILPEVSPPAAPVPPISPTWIYVGAGATVLSLALPAILYANASATSDDFFAATDAQTKVRLTNDYNAARTTAYISWAVPATLAAATGALSAYYFWGSGANKREKTSIDVRTNGTGATLIVRY